MKLIAVLKLIRYPNLLLICYVQLLIKYIFFNSFNAVTHLSTVQFGVLLLAILFIASAGYIINDLCDQKTDSINKPKNTIIGKKISVSTARSLYKSFNVLGLLFGIGLSMNILKPGYSFIFIGTSILLFYYSKILKSTLLIGNFTVAFLTALSILTPALFDLNFTIQTDVQNFVIAIVILLAIFAFLLNFIREVVKDIEDVNGDFNQHVSTLPIIIGRIRAQKVVGFICILPVSLVLYLIINYSNEFKFTTLYLLVFSLIPTLYLAIKIPSVKSVKTLKRMSTLLKIIMFLGMNTLVILSLKIL